MEIKKNVNLSEYTSWLVGGEAEYFCMPTNDNEIKEALTWAYQNNTSLTLLGGGTNVLVSDRGIKGLTLCLRRYSQVKVEEKDDHLYIHCTSGTAKSELLKIFLKHKLAPALFLAGLPGDVGGGIVMNAGVAESLAPREFCEIVDQFTVLRSEKKNQSCVFAEQTYRHQDIRWEYRHSYGWQKGLNNVITHVTLKWPLRPDPTILDQVRQANKTRLSKQPLDMPSCGSVFINPAGHKSAQLIDSCGLKGTRRGDAQVSLKHANFIVNLGNATAEDIWDLILFVQSSVKEKTGVELKTEVIRLGEWL